MPRVLLLPHAPTSSLAHVGACMAVGHVLRERGHDVQVAYGGSRPEVIEREGFRWHRVAEVAPEREWHPRGWFHEPGELIPVVESHLELIRRLSPEAAVSSSGLAGRLACEVAAVPQVHLMHYLPVSGPGRQATVRRDRLSDLRRPRRLYRVLRARAARPILRPRGPITRAIKESRERLGLPALGSGPGGSVGGCHDTAVAVTTTPFLDPAGELPPNWRYVGPVTWSAPSEGTEELPRRGDRPVVYVTQGSTGSPDTLRRSVHELGSAPVDVIVTAGGLCDPSELEELAPNCRAAALWPGRACMAMADAAVVHGGHLTTCEALLAGTPVAVLPSRRDQVRRVYTIEWLGAGVGLYPKPLFPGAVRRAVTRLLERPRYRQRSAELSAELSRWDGPAGAADLVEQVLAS
jgi:UDP:flavonoid glycosyltransferase YjiC (YdhE family)